jgi:Tfp pilus assembly protein PilF
MRGPQIYDRLVDWPDQNFLIAMFAIGVGMIVVSTILLSIGKQRWVARGLGIAGVLTLMLAMFVIHEQTDREKIGEYVTVSHTRYAEATRFQIRVALIGLPVASALVMATVFTTTRRRLRKTVPAHLKEARKLMIHGEHDAALAQLNKALSISPYLGEAYYQRGCVLQAKGQIDAALADLDHALKCDPQLAAAYLHRAKIRSDKGDFDGALADFGQVMIMRPNDVECYLHRGICLANQGVVNDAVADFQRVLKLTNHSDYADPARAYLEKFSPEAPSPRSLDAPGNNGLNSPVEPARHDHTY